MLKSVAVRSILSVLLFSLSFSNSARAQSTADKETIRKQMREVLRYIAPDKEATPEEAVQLADAWEKANRADLSSEQRKQAFLEIYIPFAKLYGRDVSQNPKVLMPLVERALSYYEAGGRFDLRLPTPRGNADQDYIHIATTGNGPIQMLLISDGGIDGRNLYASFVKRNSNRYTMHIVTLPGAGLAKWPPWPEVRDHASQPWIKSMERSIVNWVDKKNINNLVVVGTSMGGYFAARLAISRPERLRSAVLVNALVNMPQRSRANPDAPATMAERIRQANAGLPMPFLFPGPVFPSRDEMAKILDDPAISHATVQNYMAFAVKDTALSKRWTIDSLASGFFVPSFRIGGEMGTTDLTGDLKDLKVAMLVMASLPDDQSPTQGTPYVGQWEEIKLRYPTLPLTVVTYENSRAYLSEDSPKEFDAALEAFLAGKPVTGKKSNQFAARPSPQATVSQLIGATEVTIRYGRPQVKNRELVKLIQPGRVWRAGANEATTISLSCDVLIEGKSLKAGTYTFFAIPGEKEWTLIFNKVTSQWGSFNYNAEFDALRVTVPSQTDESQEWLIYRFDDLSDKSANIILQWDKLKLAIKVETAGSV